MPLIFTTFLRDFVYSAKRFRAREMRDSLLSKH